MKFNIPKEIIAIGEKLIANGFQAYLVGGCVRDLLRAQTTRTEADSAANSQRSPQESAKSPLVNDWDIATNAKPEEIQKIFSAFAKATADKPATVYENEFGTVGVKTSSDDPALAMVEVTTFRSDGKYTDKRHPDEIKFAKTIEEDLARRDFTINAMAISLSNCHPEAKPKDLKRFFALAQNDGVIVDPYEGQKDLEKKLICAVGKPEERFNEDALRLLRAVRFASQLGFVIEKETQAAVKKHAGLLEFISKERVRDELTKIIMSPDAVSGIQNLADFGLLKFIMPELLEGVGVGQNKHHIYTVFEHNLKSFEYATEQNFPFDVRLASLLHDVGKPRSKRGEGPDSTFYGHQVVGERMVLKILDQLRFPKNLIEKVALLVREHMFVYDPETVTLAGVRRLVRRAGTENIDDLFKLREADRIGSGVPKAQPYRLRHLRAMVEKVQKDPISPKMLKIKGDAVMEILKIPPGPKIGKVLAVLLEEVLENPKLNIGDKLKKRVAELGKISEAELEKLAVKAKEKAEAVQERIDSEIKKKYFV